MLVWTASLGFIDMGYFSVFLLWAVGSLVALASPILTPLNFLLFYRFVQRGMIQKAFELSIMWVMAGQLL